MSANDKQIGGNHYKKSGAALQHWDQVAMFQWDYYQAQIIKYVMRHKDKNGLQDLEKATHFLEKYIELCRLSVVVKDVDKPEGEELEWVRTVLAEEIGYVGPLTETTCPLRDLIAKGAARYIDSQIESRVKPTAYLGFTYEGGTKDWDLFRCTTCRSEVQVPPGRSPFQNHSCKGAG